MLVPKLAFSGQGRDVIVLWVLKVLSNLAVDSKGFPSIICVSH